jgi:hypothetical protein
VDKDYEEEAKEFNDQVRNLRNKIFDNLDGVNSRISCEALLQCICTLLVDCEFAIENTDEFMLWFKNKLKESHKRYKEAKLNKIL